MTLPTLPRPSSCHRRRGGGRGTEQRNADPDRQSFPGGSEPPGRVPSRPLRAAASPGEPRCCRRALRGGGVCVRLCLHVSMCLCAHGGSSLRAQQPSLQTLQCPVTRGGPAQLTCSQQQGVGGQECAGSLVQRTGFAHAAECTHPTGADDPPARASPHRGPPGPRAEETPTNTRSTSRSPDSAPGHVARAAVELRLTLAVSWCWDGAPEKRGWGGEDPGPCLLGAPRPSRRQL